MKACEIIDKLYRPRICEMAQHVMGKKPKRTQAEFKVQRFANAERHEVFAYVLITAKLSNGDIKRFGGKVTIPYSPDKFYDKVGSYHFTQAEANEHLEKMAKEYFVPKFPKQFAQAETVAMQKAKDWAAKADVPRVYMSKRDPQSFSFPLKDILEPYRYIEVRGESPSDHNRLAAFTNYLTPGDRMLHLEYHPEDHYGLVRYWVLVNPEEEAELNRALTVAAGEHVRKHLK